MTEALVAADVGRVIAFGVLIILAFVIPFAVRKFHRTDCGPRAFSGSVNPDAPDWFEPVAPYFAGRLESDERVARAVERAVYREANS